MDQNSGFILDGVYTWKMQSDQNYSLFTLIFKGVHEPSGLVREMLGFLRSS